MHEIYLCIFKVVNHYSGSCFYDVCERYFYDTNLISTPSSPPLSPISIPPLIAQFSTLSTSSPPLCLFVSLSDTRTHTHRLTPAQSRWITPTPLRSPISHPSWQSDRLHFNQQTLRGGKRDSLPSSAARDCVSINISQVPSRSVWIGWLSFVSWRWNDAQVMLRRCSHPL